VRLRALQLALAAALVGAIILRSHPGELWRVLREADLKLCLAALALNVPVLVLTPWRSSLLLRSLGHQVHPEVLIPTTILGFVAGGLTPAASGEILRAQALRNRAGVPLQDSVTAVVYERVMSLYLLVVSTGLVFALGVISGGWRIAAVASALVLCLLPWQAARAAGRLLPAEDRVRREGLVAGAVWRALSLIAQLRSLLTEAGLLLRFSAPSLAISGIGVVQYWVLARAVGGGVSVGDVWLAFGISTFAGVAALIPLGLGVLDTSLAAALDRLGMTLEQGGIVALLVRAIVTLPLVLAAFASYLYLQRIAARADGAPGAAPALADGPAFEP